MRACVSLLGFLWLATVVCGCATAGGSTTSCTSTLVLGVSPTTATADHAAAAPGDEQQFTSIQTASASPGCAVPALAEIVYPAWTNSDPVDVTISSAANSTNGLATCVNATLAPVMLAATVGSGTTAQTKTVTLSCK